MNRILKISFFAVIFFSNVFSALPDEFCGMQITTSLSSQLGGRYKPASGTFKVLVIYAQFPDDNTDIYNSNWPKGQPPAYMSGTVDEVWSTNPTPGSLTDYFNQMSFNNYKVIGKAVSIIAPRPISSFSKGDKLGELNRMIIQKLDSTFDFSPYDNWKYNYEYNHTNVSDGKVDMIYVVWRNKVDSIGLNSGYGILGGYEFSVDNGARIIETGYYGYGSGATIINGYYGTWWVYRGMQHELAHWFFGGNECHTPSGTWGILEGWGTPSDCINAYERYKLGWMNFNTIDPASYSSPTTVTIMYWFNRKRTFCKNNLVECWFIKL